MIQFFVCFNPPTVTQQEHQVRVVNAKPVFYEPAELKAARAKLKSYLAQYAPSRPLRGPLVLQVKWCFALRGDHVDGEYRSTKPDTDNLSKMLKDVMTELRFWGDDAQVCSELVEKFWARVPGLFIYVDQLHTVATLSDVEQLELEERDAACHHAAVEITDALLEESRDEELEDYPPQDPERLPRAKGFRWC